jgi:hypothetical protein
VLVSHREARRWTDEAVALDLLAQLGLDAAGEAKNAAVVGDTSLVTEAVVAPEAASLEDGTTREGAPGGTTREGAPGGTTHVHPESSDQRPAEETQADQNPGDPREARADRRSGTDRRSEGRGDRKSAGA